MSETFSLNRTPMDPLFLAGLAVFVLLLNFLYRAWRSRIHHAYHEFLSDGVDRLTFKSDLGEFIFNIEDRFFEIKYIDGRDLKFRFSDIHSIKLLKDEKDALFQEMFLEGFSVLIDTNPKYRDQVQRYSIVAVTQDYKRYPVIVMQQYVVKDWFNVGVDLQLGILELLGLYAPVEIKVRAVYEQLKQFLGKDISFNGD